MESNIDLKAKENSIPPCDFFLLVGRGAEALSKDGIIDKIKSKYYNSIKLSTSRTSSQHQDQIIVCKH